MQAINGELIFIAPEMVHKWWPIVRPCIQRLLDKTGAYGAPEDVYTALVTAKATLHIARLNGVDEGFVVLEPVYATYGNALNIWIASGFDGVSGDFTAYVPAYKELAKRFNATRLMFSSSRPGWTRQAQKIGFKPKTTTYFLEIE